MPMSFLVPLIVAPFLYDWLLCALPPSSPGVRMVGDASFLSFLMLAPSSLPLMTAPLVRSGSYSARCPCRAEGEGESPFSKLLSATVIC